MSGKAGKGVVEKERGTKNNTCKIGSASNQGNSKGSDDSEQHIVVKAEYKLLELKDKRLDKEIAQLLKDIKEQSEAKPYVELLHIYNDVKDATQLVLGNLARLENVSVTELHQQYGLSYKDNDA